MPYNFMTQKEVISLSKEDLKLVLDILEYEIDKDGVVIDKNNKNVICPFTAEPVNLDSLSIMPGSLILMNTSPVTLSEYFYRYTDD